MEYGPDAAFARGIRDVVEIALRVGSLVVDGRGGHLRREGLEVARCTVERLMGQMGLRGVIRGKEDPEGDLKIGRVLTLVVLLVGMVIAPFIGEMGGIYVFIQSLLSLFQGPMLALLVLLFFPTGHFLGLDGLLASRTRKSMHTMDHGQPDQEEGRADVTRIQRREVLKHLATVPFLGAVVYGAIRKTRMSSMEEQNLVDATSGATQRFVQQIMAGLNGTVLVDVGPGEMSIKLLDVIGADVLMQLVNAINPGKKASDTAPLVCAAVRFDIEDGIAKTRKGIALQTDRTSLVGDGTIDLKTEKISLQLRAIAAKGTGVGAGDLTKGIGVGGTLASPAAALDAAGLATTGATVGAAVATGGLSYLAQKALEKVAITLSS